MERILALQTLSLSDNYNNPLDDLGSGQSNNCSSASNQCSSISNN